MPREESESRPISIKTITTNHHLTVIATSISSSQRSVPEIGRGGKFGHETGQVGGAISQQEQNGIQLSDDVERSDEKAQLDQHRYHEDRTPRIAFVGAHHNRLQ